jgi:hypothetical protein
MKFVQNILRKNILKSITILMIITIFAIILNSGSLKDNLAKNPTKNKAKKVAMPNKIMPKKAKNGFDKELAKANAP